MTSVTVYSDGARVVRTARVNVSGSQAVEFPPLHSAVDTSSLRVEAQGAEVTRVEWRTSTPEALPTAEARQLVAELERFEEQLTQIRTERSAYLTQLDSLKQARPDPSANEAPKLDASGWKASTDFVEAATARAQTKVRELTWREETLIRDRAQRREEARQTVGASLRERLQVVATVSGQGAATLTLTYFAQGARWYPAYELRLEPESNRVEVAFAGRVSQETGEDWEDAALTLSTALPSSFTPAPQLATWKIGQRERFIPTPAPVPDSWRGPPAPTPPPPLAPGEDTRLRERLSTLLGQPPAPVAQTPPLAQQSQQSPRPSSPGKSTIVGTVVDAETKRPLMDVVVTVTSPSLQGEQVVVTDARGQYRIPELPPGIYAMRFDREAFRPFSRSEIQLRLERTIRVNVEMLPDSLSEAIAVTARPPTIDVGSSSTGIHIESGYVVDSLGAGSPGRGTPMFPELPPVNVPVGLEPPAGWRRPSLDSRLPASLAGGQALSFPAQRRETVRSGQGERRVPLFTETWPVQVERELFPALTANAFLVAQLRSPSKQVLPGGEAQLFVGADPSGQAQLKLVSPGEPFTLPLGIDPAVRPVRNVRLVTSEKGFISKDDVTEYAVTLEVANPYPFPLSVRLHDQWPLRYDKNVEVKLVSTEPFAEQDADKGTLEWRLSIPPSSKREVTFRYTVSHPKNWRLQQRQ
ncbi:mucoidy inhibitor MuiA family protein [Archangium lansingense]|uniref:Mucoidy inhibitor MuiA family protein n=1 Tax=Archangium lansingense TaxID=2995310 RepID=A0ABT4A6L2_9BACT|nr:mucoidy inhibitor MuiA family protein [Archangium lansinium]MCY1077296.1 mucoidy inhibitor MuiA family protein [Archangium lansinium]